MSEKTTRSVADRMAESALNLRDPELLKIALRLKENDGWCRGYREAVAMFKQELAA